MLRDMDPEDLPSDFDPEDLEKALQSGSDSDEDRAAGSDSSDTDEAFGEFGISDEEMFDPGDDDDHEEMGEVGSDSDEDAYEGILDESDLDSDAGSSVGEREGEVAPEAEARDQAPMGGQASAPKPAAAGSYVPPHLRKQAGAAAPPAASPASVEPEASASKPALEAPPEDPRLRRQINGQLNKLSTSNMAAIVDQLLSIYASNPRAVVSTTMISLLLGIIADRDNLGDQLVVTYAVLVAALFRTVGVEFPAGVVARSVELFDAAFKKHAEAAADGADPSAADEGADFEGRPGSKECLNLVSFIAELYNFQVVHCGLVYDFVRLLIESGLGELQVELLSRIVKRECFCLLIALPRIWDDGSDHSSSWQVPVNSSGRTTLRR